MKIVDETELRKHFRQFADDEMYTRFVKACVEARGSRKRMRYWQEAVWARFVNECPEYASLSVLVVLDALYVCHLHGNELTRRTIHIPAKLVITTVSSGDPRAPYGYRHPFASPKSDQTRELDLDVCNKCLAVTQPPAQSSRV